MFGKPRATIRGVWIINLENGYKFQKDGTLLEIRNEMAELYSEANRLPRFTTVSCYDDNDDLIAELSNHQINILEMDIESEISVIRSGIEMVNLAFVRGYKEATSI